MVNLDIDNLPIIKNQISILRKIPFDKFPKLKELGAISERIYGCWNFNSYNNVDNDLPYFKEKAYLRATLNEFVSISEILKEKYIDISIEKTNIPLLHFFKELRVTNFHIKTFVPNTIKSTVLLTNKEEVTNENFELELFVIENCDIELFFSNFNYIKYYSSVEFEQIVNWVNKNQYIWGINYIIDFALNQYCELINKTVTNTSD